MSPEDCAAAVHEHSARVQRWAAKYAPRGVDPRDVAQDAFRVLLVRRELVAVGAVRDWLHTTTWNICLDLKKRAARRARLGEVLVAEVPDIPAEHDVEATLASAELSKPVQEALEKLAAQERRLAQSVVMASIPIAEVAREEKLPESTVRKRLASALARLRTRFVKERHNEQFRTGGFASWGVMWGVVLGWHGCVVARVTRLKAWLQALAARAWPKLVSFAMAVTGIGALVAGVSVLTGGAPAGAAHPPVAEELPAVALEVRPPAFASDPPMAPSSAEKAEPGLAEDAPKRPALSPRRRHDAHAHFEEQAFGAAAPRRP